VQILANAIPGFRDLRAPVIAGYLWLLLAWGLVNPNLSRRPHDRLGEAFFELGHRVGHIGIAIAVSVAAYFVGSLSQIFSTMYAQVASQALSRATYGIESSTRQQIEKIALAFQDELRASSSPIADEVRQGLNERVKRADAEASSELNLPATLLVGGEPQLFAEVDRLRAESELRLAVALPLISLSCLASVESSWIWSVGGLAAAVLFVDGLRKERSSKQLVSNAIARGLIKSSSIEELRGWISSAQTALADARSRLAAP